MYTRTPVLCCSTIIKPFVKRTIVARNGNSSTLNVAARGFHSSHVRQIGRSQALQSDKFQNYRLNGSVVATITPFDENGNIEYDLIDPYVEYLQEHHCDHVFVNGTTGEGVSMTVDERKKTAEVWKKATDGKMKMMLHVGDNNLPNTQELARHAQQIGADAFTAVCPSYFKPESEDVLLDYMMRVSSEAPDLPFYYYCNNPMSGATTNAAKFLQLAKDKMPNLCGVKYSSRDLYIANQCAMVDGGRFQVMMGTDVNFLEYLVLGIDVPVLQSYVGDIFHNIKSSYDKGDLEQARKHQRQAQELRKIKMKYGGGFGTVKAMCSIVAGLGGHTARLPLTSLTKDQRENLRKDLEIGGFLHEK